jgi:hypothetical protein
MTNTTPPKLYRPNRLTGVIVLLVTILFFTYGVAMLVGFIVLPLDSRRGEMVVWFVVMICALVLVGGWLTVMSCVSLTGCVVVHTQGLTKSFRFLRRGFSFSWDAVESWSVQIRDPKDTPTRVVWFTVRGQRWPAAVWDDEACRPSFDRFLQDVRACAGAKEQELW